MHKAIVHLFGGTTDIEVQADSQQDLIRQLKFYSNLPQVCPICKAAIGFDYHEAEGFKFYSLSCSGPVRHEANFGQYKAGGLFYKGEWKRMQRGQDGEVEAPALPPAPVEPPPAWLDHLGQMLRVAGLTAGDAASAADRAAIQREAKNFVGFLLGTKVAAFKALEGWAVVAMLESLGSYTSPEQYEPDRTKIARAKKRYELKLAEGKELSFDRLGA